MIASETINRVVRVSRLGAADVLQISHEPVREPATGEVRLRVHALGLNRAEITGGQGARIVFDPVAGPFLETLAGIVASEGVIIEYGWLQPGTPVFPLVPALVKGFSVRGFHLSYQLIPYPDRLAAALGYVSARLENGVFRPLLADRGFTLDQIADAYRHMESNEQLGKNVVTNSLPGRAQGLELSGSGDIVGRKQDQTLEDALQPEIAMKS